MSAWRLGSYLLGLVMAVAIVGTSLLALQAPVFTRVLARAYSVPPGAATVELAEKGRRFVVAGDEAMRPEVTRAFGDEATSHLDDVRAVLARANCAGWLTLGFSVLGAGLMLGAGRRPDLARAIRVATTTLAVVVVLAAAAAVLDFAAFFSAFHSLFFAEGTWVFPADSVLIGVYPEEFWMACGVAWAGTAALISALLWLAAGRLRSPRGEAVESGRIVSKK